MQANGSETQCVAVIGHRGSMAREAENSFAAFERGIRDGSDMLEMDARCTSDGEVVIMHDETVDRTTDGRGRVSDMTLADIGKLRLRNGEPVPTLDEILERFGGRCALNIELKDSGSVAASCDAVRRKKMLDSVLFSSFHSPWLVTLKLRCPKARAAVLCKDRDVDMLRIAASIGAEAIHPSRRIVTRELIAKAHTEGLKVNVWTVNMSWQAKRFIAWGADGIVTDKPDVLAALLEKLGMRG